MGNVNESGENVGSTFRARHSFYKKPSRGKFSVTASSSSMTSTRSNASMRFRGAMRTAANRTLRGTRISMESLTRMKKKKTFQTMDIPVSQMESNESNATKGVVRKPWEELFDSELLTTSTKAVGKVLKKKFHLLKESVSSLIIDNITESDSKVKSITKEGLIKAWEKEFGDYVNLDLFNHLFDLMDSDSDGLVDETEFILMMTFLLKGRSSNKNKKTNSRLLFELFDVYGEGCLTQEQFSYMLSTMVGTQITVIMNVPYYKDYLHEFCQEKLCHENVLFYENIAKYISVTKSFVEDKMIMNYEYLDMEENIFDYIVKTFILTDSVHCINISGRERLHIIDVYSSSNRENKKSEIFKSAYKEVRMLLQMNVVYDFKENIRKAPYSRLTTDVWVRFGLKPQESLSYQEFKQWSDETSGVFNFLKELQEKFREPIEKEALKWAIKSTREQNEVQQLKELNQLEKADSAELGDNNGQLGGESKGVVVDEKDLSLLI